jgi:hypothetical protein
LFPRLAACTEIISTFDSDLDGWVFNSNGSIWAHRTSGGNPGGYVYIEDNAPVTGMFAWAPAKFLGDLSGFNGGVLSVDLRLEMIPDQNYDESYGRILIEGSSGFAQKDIVIGPATTSWETYGAQLSAEEWGLSEEDWADLLSSVTLIRITLEAGANDDATGIDNFLLKNDGLPPKIISLCPPFADIGDTVSIWGKDFGNTQGNCDICLNGMCFSNEKLVVEYWSDNRIDIVVPSFKCKRFKYKDSEDYKDSIKPILTITCGDQISNVKRLEVFRPIDCPPPVQ